MLENMIDKPIDKKIDIAVIGATGLVGAAVLDHLAESDISVGRIFALASGNAETTSVSFGHRHLTVQALSDFDFKQVQLCFFCVPAAITDEYIGQATSAGCYCIDFSTRSRLQEGVPLIVHGVNDDDLEKLDGKIVASPDSSIVHLAQIMAPLKRLGVIERVNATLLRAVSEVGRKGVDELSQQSIALFNLRPIKNECFATQIAFNALPHTCHADETDPLVSSLQDELAKVLHDEALLLNVSLTQVSVFYGHSMTLQLEFGQAVALSEVKSAFGSAAQIHDIDQKANRPDSISDAVNQEGVFVGCVRQDPTWQDGINLWAVGDNIHQGAAINGVQTAQILVKSYL